MFASSWNRYLPLNAVKGLWGLGGVGLITYQGSCFGNYSLLTSQSWRCTVWSTAAAKLMPREGSTLSHAGKHSVCKSRSRLWLRLCVSAGVTEASLHLPGALLDTAASAAPTGGCWAHDLGSPLSRNDSLAPSLQRELWSEGWLKTGECLTPRCEFLEQEKKSDLKTFAFLNQDGFVPLTSVFQLWLWAELTRKLVRDERVVASTTHRLLPAFNSRDLCSDQHAARHVGMHSRNPTSRQVPLLFNIFLSLYTCLEKHHLPAGFSWEFLTSAQFSQIIWRWCYLLVLCFSKSLPTACHLSSAPHTWLY